MRRLALAVAVALAAALSAAPARALPGWASVPISSSFGSGDFGRWRADRFGLPSYRYAIDERTAPFARQPELAGSDNAAHQVGNDHIVADAFNHGYVELWSQDRRYEWTNRYDAAARHFAGGYGYLKVGARIVSTLYDDRPTGSRSVRDFGVGYFRHTTAADGMAVQEYVYAPFGDDATLLHDVTIRNTTARSQRVSWFEYWDVDPFDQATKTPIAVGGIEWHPALDLLLAPQLATAQDRRPLTIFAAQLRGAGGGHVADTAAFFGTGGRGAPTAVAADRLDGALAPAGSRRGMFAFRSSIALRPGASVTLRYAYGAAPAGDVGGLVRRYRRARDPLRASERRWRAWLPQIEFGRGLAWLSRELQWDAYTIRSGATYEQCRGRHIISQGGYYQYDIGFQGAFRDPLQHMLPMVYSDPSLARDVLLYSAQEQPRGDGQIPYAMSELCQKFKFGNADDLDLWLLLAAAEYGLGTRDLRLFEQPVRYADTGSGSLWSHLKLAFHHQESLRGPHGGYVVLDTGDWSDLSTAFLGMTESTLVDGQAAYIYPRLAELADLRGDRAFASELRRAAARDLKVVRRQWTMRGWYARGYAGDRLIGTGAIFGESQPWPVLAGAPSAEQARTLVARVRRFLTGVGAPARLKGPSRIGSAQSPAAADLGITEHSSTGAGLGSGAAVFPGGSWYAIDGWLTWALGSLGGIVPHARQYAFAELERNTLAAHANAYPRHWDGTISVDDVCHAFYSPTPASCGAGLTTGYEGQIMHQPAWSLFAAIRLAGITPTTSGFQIVPELPFHTFSLGLPDIGVAYHADGVRGYVVSASGRALTMRVKVPAVKRWRVHVGGRHVRSRARGRIVTFRLTARAHRAVNWQISP